MVKYHNSGTKGMNVFMNELGMGFFRLFVELAALHELSGLQAVFAGLSQTMRNAVIVIGVITCIAGLLQCFFGYKLFRFWCGLIGFLIGCFLGLVIAAAGVYSGFPAAGLIGLLITLFLGITGALIAYGLYVVGLFIYAFTVAFLVVYYLFTLIVDSAIVCLIAGIIAGITLGILAIYYRRLVIIASTSVSGGISAVIGFMMATQNFDLGYGVILLPILIIAGFIVQYMTVKKTKKKPKRSLARTAARQVNPANQPPANQPPANPVNQSQVNPADQPQVNYEAAYQPNPAVPYEAPPPTAPTAPPPVAPAAPPPVAPIVPPPAAPVAPSQTTSAPPSYRCIECGFSAPNNTAPCSSCGGAVRRAPSSL